jgi:hypothetical protein
MRADVILFLERLLFSVGLQILPHPPAGIATRLLSLTL